MPAARLALLLWLAAASGCERQANSFAESALELQKDAIVGNYLRGIADADRCAVFKARILTAAESRCGSTRSWSRSASRTIPTPAYWRVRGTVLRKDGQPTQYTAEMDQLEYEMEKRRQPLPSPGQIKF